MSSNWNKILSAMGIEIDQLRDAVTETINQSWIDTAVGNQLDEMGSLLGLPRQTNELDSQYKSRLKAYVQAVDGGATHSQLQLATSGYVNVPSSAVEVIDEYLTPPHDTIVVNHYAHLRVRFDIAQREGVYPINIDDLTTILDVNKPGGVTIDAAEAYFEDEFDGTTLNTNLWDNTGGTPIVGSGLVEPRGANVFTRDNLFIYQCFEVRFHLEVDGQSIGLDNGETGATFDAVRFRRSGGNIFFETYNNNNLQSTNVGSAAGTASYFILWNSTGVVCIKNGSGTFIHTTQVPNTRMFAYMDSNGETGPTNWMEVEYFRVYAPIFRSDFNYGPGAPNNWEWSIVGTPNVSDWIGAAGSGLRNTQNEETNGLQKTRYKKLILMSQISSNSFVGGQFGFGSRNGNDKIYFRSNSSGQVASIVVKNGSIVYNQATNGTFSGMGMYRIHWYEDKIEWVDELETVIKTLTDVDKMITEPKLGVFASHENVGTNTQSVRFMIVI